jgi:hypothetical protein
MTCPRYLDKSVPSFQIDDVQKDMKILIQTKLVCCVLLPAHAQDKLYKNEFALGEVTIGNSLFRHARDLHIETLLKYDVERLLSGYRSFQDSLANISIHPR